MNPIAEHDCAEVFLLLFIVVVSLVPAHFHISKMFCGSWTTMPMTLMMMLTTIKINKWKNKMNSDADAIKEKY